MNVTDLEDSVHRWDTLKILTPDGSKFSYVVMILNQPIRHNRAAMLSLWQNASLRITVDGGTNRWFKFSEEESCSLPDFITGDLDSVEECVLDYYKKRGVPVVVTPDQNKTDFTKAALFAVEHLGKVKIKVDALVAVVQSAGRMDHIFANINTLFKMTHVEGAMPVYLLSSDSLTWLLRPGSHEISLPPDLVAEKVWCGLIPIGGKANSVTTTGLKWNLNDTPMEFGGCVSTSNKYCEEVVTIKTDSFLLWTMGLQKDDVS
ncbi:thiamin pyrophosphokinase 1 [Schistocerca americana]|uniref:thiamin pyrophosphokinase 1 n=1 Tax=Schistocerca americana TaxID=7009 RepID=UPI001F5037E2|nr:thiamin pyrophosphokinase 1 [Schistocerca americana]XP_047108993.1 thiamin pyrophosphokinase 1 [Schistocerca piceifrons]XP_049947158.1 thiamin pyrophosphokinase 1 [Schistocerca serialis cubense]